MRAALLFLCVAALFGCDKGPPEIAVPPVVVYAYGDDTTGIATRLAGFTEANGTPIQIIHGDSGALTDDVIGNRGSPKADVLLTSNVADIWRAADEGALRPIQSSALADVKSEGRDADDLWVAFESYSAVIGSAQRVETRVTSYMGLARPDIGGEVCLSSSQLPINRAVVARLIEEHGLKRAERVVRAWVRNQKLAPFATEAELVAALADGTCGYGLFSSDIEAPGVWVADPFPEYFNIRALGVARHAQNPDAAQALVDWVIVNIPLDIPDENGKSAGRIGWLDEDVRLLAERAGYR
ncbi:MAG: extracellular solute-binding protein [Woeseiaceae bacterium]|nr:extracellular solute-binding protein [Woeseiaceae bacterium]